MPYWSQISLLGLLTCIYNSLVTFLAAYYTFYSKKKDFKDIILGCVWISVSLHYFFVTIAVPFYPVSVPTFTVLYFIGYTFIFLQLTVGAFYLVVKITKNFLIRFLSASILIGLLIYLVFFFLQNATVARDQGGEFYLAANVQTPMGYGMALMMGIIIFLCFLLVLYDFRKGVFSWVNMAEFYKFYAFIVFVAISLLKTLRFLPYSWYLEIFYALPAYLMYRSKKESEI